MITRILTPPLIVCSNQCPGLRKLSDLPEVPPYEFLMVSVFAHGTQLDGESKEGLTGKPVLFTDNLH